MTKKEENNKKEKKKDKDPDDNKKIEDFINRRIDEDENKDDISKMIDIQKEKHEYKQTRQVICKNGKRINPEHFSFIPIFGIEQQLTNLTSVMVKSMVSDKPTKIVVRGKRGTGKSLAITTVIEYFTLINPRLSVVKGIKFYNLEIDPIDLKDLSKESQIPIIHFDLPSFGDADSVSFIEKITESKVIPIIETRTLHNISKLKNSGYTIINFYPYSEEIRFKHLNQYIGKVFRENVISPKCVKKIATIQEYDIRDTMMWLKKIQDKAIEIGSQLITENLIDDVIRENDPKLIQKQKIENLNLRQKKALLALDQVTKSKISPNVDNIYKNMKDEFKKKDFPRIQLLQTELNELQFKNLVSTKKRSNEWKPRYYINFLFEIYCDQFWNEINNL